MSRPKKKIRAKPIILLILEGWGIAPAHPGNAITEAQPEYFNYLLNHYPALALAASGPALGTDFCTSECGHALIGGGQPLSSPGALVDASLANGTFLKNPLLRSTFKKARGGRLHLVGLLSFSDKEASLQQLEALISAAREFGVASVFLHAILDGRDSTNRAGAEIVAALETQLEGIGKVATLQGRFYALDPFQHAPRLDKAAQLIARGEGNHFTTTIEAFEATYEKKIFDEDFSPAVILELSQNEAKLSCIEAADTVIFFNIASTIRPLAKIISDIQPDASYASLRDYGLEKITPLFTGSEVVSSLGSVIADAGFRQLRVSDSEGFAAVSVWLNNGRETAFSDEDRVIFSTSVRERYEDEIGAGDELIAREIVRAAELQAIDFIAASFASLDRLAHEMDLGTAVAGVRALDAVLKRIVTSALSVGGTVVITSSHGLAEQTIMPHEQARSAHAESLVPLLLIGKEFEGLSLGRPQPIDGDLSLVAPAGSLIDVAPTLLELLQLPKPSDMKGCSLLIPLA